MSGFKMVGWFVVGEGKFGTYAYGREFVPYNEDETVNLSYWYNRGYETEPVFVRN
jgi:hypothetical protein